MVPDFPQLAGQAMARYTVIKKSKLLQHLLSPGNLICPTNVITSTSAICIGTNVSHVPQLHAHSWAAALQCRAEVPGVLPLSCAVHTVYTTDAFTRHNNLL